MTQDLFFPFPRRDGWAYAAAVDTETTGLGGDARVVQLAALRFRWRWISGSVEVEMSPRYRLVTLVRPPPGTRFCPRAEAVTGIGERRVAGAPPFPEVLPALMETCGDLPIVAHNAAFDRRMLLGEQARCGAEPLPHRWECSQAAARRAGHARLKLGELAEALGVRATGGLHDAGVDAELAARVMAAVTSH